MPSKRDERSSSNKNNTTNRVYTHNNDSSNSYLDDYTSYTDDDPDDKQNPFSSTNDITRHNEDDTLAEDSELADGEYDSMRAPRGGSQIDYPSRSTSWETGSTRALRRSHGPTQR